MDRDRDASEPDRRGETAWLTIDRGNTTLDCMWGGDGGRRARLEPSPVAFAEFVAERVPTRVVAASVVTRPGEGLEAVHQHFAAPRYRDLVLERAGRDLPCPLELVYDTAETLGADRWLAATAAAQRYGSAIVVDAGTAVTIDAVAVDAATKRGRYLGGAIAPGAQTMAAGLALRAPGLPTAASRESVSLELPPRSSQSAVDVGVFLGFAAAVEGLVDRMARAVGFAADTSVVLTGGEAELLAAHTERTFQVEPDLVHAGLRCLLRNSLRSTS